MTDRLPIVLIKVVSHGGQMGAELGKMRMEPGLMLYQKQEK